MGSEVFFRFTSPTSGTIRFKILISTKSTAFMKEIVNLFHLKKMSAGAKNLLLVIHR